MKSTIWLPGFALSLLFPAVANTTQLQGGVPDTIPGAVINEGEMTLPGSSGRALPCISHALGTPIHWTSYPTPRLLKMLERQELDLAYPMGFNTERDQVLQRSEAVFRSRDVWVFKDVRPKLEDKVNLTIAAKNGSPQADYLAKEGYRQVSLVTSYESLVRMLEVGRVQVIAVPGEGWDRFAPTLTWQTRTETYLTRDVGFYVSKSGNAKLLDRLNQSVKSCRE